MKKKLPFLVFCFLAGSGWATILAQQFDMDNLNVKEPPDASHVCEITPTDINANLYIGPNREVLKRLGSAAAAVFEVDYVVAAGESCGDSTWPSEALEAFEHAMEVWGMHLQSDVPLKVQAIWREIDSDSESSITLGSAGPSRVVQFQGENTWYSLAQATAMTGQPVRELIDTPDGEEIEHDVIVNMNCDFGQWYFGTDANTPANHIDFSTVVIHEIGHGIGFFGSMFVPEDEDHEDEYLEIGGWGLGEPGDPVILDRFAVDGNTNELLNESVYPNPSEELYRALTGQRGGLFFDGEETRNTQEGEPGRLYAPEEWSPGSSFSHVDQNTYSGTVNALMRPRMDRALAVHSPGPLFCGMLADMGWPLGVGCLSFLAADAMIVFDTRQMDYGVTNAGETVEKTLIISSDTSSVETLSGALEIDDDNYTISGSSNFSLEPGESTEITILYRPRSERRHSAALSVFHNAKNEQSPVTVSLRGEALQEDQIVKLDQSYPNPVVPENPAPKIPYALSEDAHVLLDLFTIQGQRVQTLVNSMQQSGRYEVDVDLSGLASGVYIYRIVVGEHVKSRKLMVVN